MKIKQIFTVAFLLEIYLTSIDGRHIISYLRPTSKLNQRIGNLRHEDYEDAQHDDEPGKPYKFDYKVKDNNKNQFHHFVNSDGNVVIGEYEVLLPDNRIQTVKYIADSQNGYRAEVSYRFKEWGYGGGSGTQPCEEGFNGSNCNKIIHVEDTIPDYDDPD